MLPTAIAPNGRDRDSHNLKVTMKNKTNKMFPSTHYRYYYLPIVTYPSRSSSDRPNGSQSFRFVQQSHRSYSIFVPSRGTDCAIFNSLSDIVSRGHNLLIRSGARKKKQENEESTKEMRTRERVLCQSSLVVRAVQLARGRYFIPRPMCVTHCDVDKSSLLLSYI